MGAEKFSEIYITLHYTLRFMPFAMPHNYSDPCIAIVMPSAIAILASTLDPLTFEFVAKRQLLQGLAVQL